MSQLISKREDSCYYEGYIFNKSLKALKYLKLKLIYCWELNNPAFVIVKSP